MERTLNTMQQAMGALATHSRPASPTVAPKGAQDYIRAVRRRSWIVLGLFLLTLIPGIIYALRKPPIYRAEAVLKVALLQNDPALSQLLPHQVAGKTDSSDSTIYIHNCIALLKSDMLAKATGRMPEILTSAPAKSNPAKELRGITARIPTRSNLVELALEGNDPTWIAKLLQAHAQQLVSYTKAKDHEIAINETQKKANDNISQMSSILKGMDENLANMLKATTTIDPSGTSLLERRVVALESILLQERSRLEVQEQQLIINQYAPKPKDFQGPSAGDRKLEELYAQLDGLDGKSDRVQHIARNAKGDAATRRLTEDMKRLTDQINALEARRNQDRSKDATKDPTRVVIQHSKESIAQLQEEIQRLNQMVLEERPIQQQYQTLLKKRDAQMTALHEAEGRLHDFSLIAKALMERPPVTILQDATEPNEPIGPNRAMIIMMAGTFGLALGIGLVCLLEHGDNSVRRPDSLAVDLNIPVYGIVPWVPRTAATDRGGHLWALGEPTSPASNAFRNLRASLLGPVEPIITLLVTSAKSGEGKTTTALNLAATCARAGERTLLVDVDLRRPSLDQAFPGCGGGTGLIDILRGEIPWQRAIRPTDLGHLDVLTSGDSEGLPVEILGTREMRQLLESLALHYDRVILDGPSVLGMAECRMLGRAADATLFVVRAGSQTLTPIRRAKEMLEQSRVRIAGVVLNALREDLRNWSNTEVRLARGGESRGPGLRGSRPEGDSGDEMVSESEVIVGGGAAPWA